jgi:hypothetical protein
MPTLTMIDAMEELARYEEGPASVVVSRDGAELVFWSSYDDYGRTIVEESRIPVADFVAKGEGPWPWYDLRDKRQGVLLVFDALGVDPPAWTRTLPANVLELFRRAQYGSSSIKELLANGVDPDPVDGCGASPLWYGVRSLSPTAPVALIDAGADAGRRIELSAQGDRYTTILHEIVRRGLTTALEHALARGVNPSPLDSNGATPMHVVDENNDHVNPEIVRRLAAAGADVNAATPSGFQPVENAARRILPATVAAMVDLGAYPQRGLDALMSWWAMNASYAAYRARQVTDMIEMLCAGGALVTDRHCQLAATAGSADVVATLG